MQVNVGMRSGLLCLLASLAITSSMLVACGSEATAPPTDPVTSPDRKADNGDDDNNKSDGKDGTLNGKGDRTPEAQTPPSSADPKTGDPTKHFTCETAKDLGQLAGDIGTPSVTYEGTCSEWVKIRVLESSTSVIAAAEKLAVTLIPNKGSTDFEVRAYVNKEFDSPECALPSAETSSPEEKSQLVKLEWGETFSGNNADDSRTVNIHVKSKDANCTTKTWTLLVQGNQ
jgi:hypothetical protein